MSCALGKVGMALKDEQPMAIQHVCMARTYLSSLHLVVTQALMPREERNSLPLQNQDVTHIRKKVSVYY